MDDTTDKYCNYKTTDCTVTSTRDLYKGLNFPKRFECPCEPLRRSQLTYFLTLFFFNFLKMPSLDTGSKDRTRTASTRQRVRIMAFLPQLPTPFHQGKGCRNDVGLFSVLPFYR